MQVILDVNEPLVAGFWIEKGKDLIWVGFKYERLGDFCYLCGCLNHMDVDYPRRKQGPVMDSKGNPLYGPWLCVPQVSQQHNMVLAQTFRGRKILKWFIAIKIGREGEHDTIPEGGDLEAPHRLVARGSLDGEEEESKARSLFHINNVMEMVRKVRTNVCAGHLQGLNHIGGVSS